MVPIALTCPVWWVARWTARMLASLAVVVACSLGTTTLSVAAAATAPTAPRPAGLSIVHVAQSGSVATGHTVTGAVISGVPATVGRTTRIRSDARTDSPDWSAATGSSGRAVAAGTARGGRATATDHPAAVFPAGGPAAMQWPAPVAPVDRHRVLVGSVPATVGSRAPPAR